MVDLVYHMLTTTLTVIGIAVLGVTGNVTSIGGYSTSMEVQSRLFDGLGMAMGGFIFVGHDNDDWLVAHEYGHVIQRRKYGASYFALVVLPSILSFHFSSGDERHTNRWFELEATKYGAGSPW
jgi:hypothetical protein